MKEIYTKAFVRFLKEKGAYHAYCKNTIESQRFNNNRSLRNFFYCINALSSYLTAAFRWDGTKEGGEYWADLSNEWDTETMWKKIY